MYRIADMPLSLSMINKLGDAYLWHWVEIIQLFGNIF